MLPEDRYVGMLFSFVFMMIGWLFAPFDTQPIAAYWVSVVMAIIGFCGIVYFDIFCSNWWINRKKRK